MVEILWVTYEYQQSTIPTTYNPFGLPVSLKKAKITHIGSLIQVLKSTFSCLKIIKNTCGNQREKERFAEGEKHINNHQDEMAQKIHKVMAKK